MGNDVIFEAKVTATGDVDEGGRRLVVLADAVELHERDGRVRDRVTLDDIERVQVHRRLTTTTVAIERIGTETPLRVKGVSPASAGQLRDVIGALLVPERGPVGSTPTVEALRRLEELARLGLVTDKELAEKRARLIRRRA